jgi:hypothetical protein
MYENYEGLPVMPDLTQGLSPAKRESRLLFPGEGQSLRQRGNRSKLLQPDAEVAHSYNVLGEPEKARDAIAHAVRLKPNDKDVQLTLAETQKALAAPGRQRMIR